MTQLRNSYLYLSYHLSFLRPKIFIDWQQLHITGYSWDVPWHLHFFLQFLVIYIFDDHASFRTNIVIRTKSGSQLIHFSLSLGQIHASLLDHFLATAPLSLNIDVMVRPNQQSKLEILSLLPLWHYDEVVFPLGKSRTQSDALAVWIFTLNPSITVELSLHEQYS